MLCRYGIRYPVWNKDQDLRKNLDQHPGLSGMKQLPGEYLLDQDEQAGKRQVFRELKI